MIRNMISGYSLSTLLPLEQGIEPQEWLSNYVYPTLMDLKPPPTLQLLLLAQLRLPSWSLYPSSNSFPSPVSLSPLGGRFDLELSTSE